MKKQIDIIYAGNNLSGKTNYNSSIAVLSSLLKENYNLIVVSGQLNKTVRGFDICWTIFKNRNRTNFILLDTFSSSYFYLALVVSQLARLLKIKYIPILRGGNLPYRLETAPFLSKLIFSHAYVNVAPSNYLKKAFSEHGFKVIFIPNILNISKYIFKIRKTLKPNLLWVRAFDKTYNPLMAVEVLNELKKQYTDAKLCMIGPFKDNTYQETLDLIKHYKLQDSVEITGVLPKEEWHKKSADYDIFINTTNFDNTPVSVMEAMALGLPIISTNAGGLPFLIQDKEDGVLVEKGDVNQMTKAIVNLLKTPLFAYELSLQARKKAETFDWSQVKLLWFDILK